MLGSYFPSYGSFTNQTIIKQSELRQIRRFPAWLIVSLTCPAMNTQPAWIRHVVGPSCNDRACRHVGAGSVHGEPTLIRWLHGCWGRIFRRVLSAPQEAYCPVVGLQPRGVDTRPIRAVLPSGAMLRCAVTVDYTAVDLYKRLNRNKYAKYSDVDKPARWSA